MTHRLANSISLFLCRKGSIAEDDIDIYTYGFEVFLDTILETFILLTVGVMLKHLLETIFFIGVFGLLRSYTGGYHAPNKVLCTIMTVLTCVINVVFSCIISKYTVVYVVMGGVGIMIIWKLAPKSHTNKPLDSTQKKKSRFVSRVLCVIYFIGILICANNVVKITNVWAFTLFQVSILLLGKEDNAEEIRA